MAGQKNLAYSILCRLVVLFYFLIFKRSFSKRLDGRRGLLGHEDVFDPFVFFYHHSLAAPNLSKFGGSLAAPLARAAIEVAGVLKAAGEGYLAIPPSVGIMPPLLGFAEGQHFGHADSDHSPLRRTLITHHGDPDHIVRLGERGNQREREQCR